MDKEPELDYDMTATRYVETKEELIKEIKSSIGEGAELYVRTPYSNRYVSIPYGMKIFYAGLLAVTIPTGVLRKVSEILSKFNKRHG